MVIYLVTRSIFLFGIAILLVLPATVKGARTCAITAIEIQNATEWRIAPGEPIALAFQVDAECEPPQNKADERRAEREVGRMLSARVELDGAVFTNRLSEGMLNDVAAFEPKPISGETAPTREAVGKKIRQRFDFIGNIFMVNAKKDRRFVFETPGAHTIVFGEVDGPRATVSVVVDAPTLAERAIIEKLYADDLLLTLARVDDCSGYSAHRVAQLKDMLEQADGTRYQKYLSIAVGVGSMCELQKDHAAMLEKTLERNPTAQVDRTTFEASLLESAKFFEQATPSDIDSEFDIVAILNLSQFELLRAKNASSAAEMEQHHAEFTRISKQIVASPLASRRWSERFRIQAMQAESLKSTFGKR